MATEHAPAALPAFPTSPRSRWSGAIAFALTELRVQLHETLALATSMVVQVVFILFVWLLSPDLLPYALVGAVLFSIFQIGERVLNESAYIRIDHRLSELYFASPLTPESYFLGMAMGVMGAYLPPVAILVAVAEIVHPLPPAAAGTLLVGALGLWLFASSIGYMLSTTFEDSRAIWPYSSILYNSFGVLPPVFYPLATWQSIVPPEISSLALVLPPSACAALVTHAEGLTPLTGGQEVLAVAAVVLETLALFACAVHVARRRAREE